MSDSNGTFKVIRKYHNPSQTFYSTGYDNVLNNRYTRSEGKDVMGQVGRTPQEEETIIISSKSVRPSNPEE